MNVERYPDLCSRCMHGTVWSIEEHVDGHEVFLYICMSDDGEFNKACREGKCGAFDDEKDHCEDPEPWLPFGEPQGAGVL